MFLLIAEFIYNNCKNISTRYIFFKLNYRYNPTILFEKDTNLCSKSKLLNKLANKLKNLIIIYQKIFYYIQ